MSPFSYILWCWHNANVFPARYLLSVAFKRIFLFKCTVGVLRFTNVLLSLALPPLLSHLLARLRRDRPPQSLLEPTTESIVISLFPIAWFFSFLYYTETGSLVLVLACLLASLESQHTLAALVCRSRYLSLHSSQLISLYQLGLLSCTFRQTNITWMMYAMAVGALKHLHQLSSTVGSQRSQAPLYDPPASQATICKFVKQSQNMLGNQVSSNFPHSRRHSVPSFATRCNYIGQEYIASIYLSMCCVCNFGCLERRNSLGLANRLKLPPVAHV